MNFQEYQVLKQKAKEKYDRELQSIESTWELYKEHFLGGNKQGRKQNKTELLKTAIESIAEPFNVRDIEEFLKSTGESLEKVFLYNTLNRLAKRDHYLEVVETGSGKRATKYKKASPQEAKSNTDILS